MQTEQKQSCSLVRDGRLSPAEVSCEITDILVKAQRGWAVADNLSQEYFGCSAEFLKDNPYYLQTYYKAAGLFAEIATEYLNETMSMLERLMEHIEAIPEGAGVNEISKIIQALDSNPDLFHVMKAAIEVQSPEAIKQATDFLKGAKKNED